MIKIGIIGCGYWGPNYIRIFQELKKCQIISCCDIDKSNLDKIKSLKGALNFKLLSSYAKLAKDSNIDAVSIATPLNSHYKIAKACLENGKHVLVEKPFTSNSKEAEELIKIAQENKLILMVGHVYKYNPGVSKLKEIIKDGILGDVYYVTAERAGLGPIRKHVSALWDLATHDISVIIHILDEFPTQVMAVGEYYLQQGIKDLVFLSLKFDSRVVCNISASWLAPEKIRKTIVVGSKGMAIFDDVNKMNTLRIYENNIDKTLLNSTPYYIDHQHIIKTGKVYSPRIKHEEPLKIQMKDFLECIMKDKKPISDSKDGLMVVKILEAAEKSLKNKETVKCRLKMLN